MKLSKEQPKQMFSRVVKVSRNHLNVPNYTTQRCHQCGSIMGQNGYKKLTLKDREWTCPICRTHHIRDWNAAVNILEKGLGKWQNPKIKEAA